MAGRFPLAVGSKTNNSKPGRAVGTTCACASAYGRRDAPSPVGLCLLCLDLCLVLEMLAGFAQEFFTRNVEATILF